MNSFSNLFLIFSLLFGICTTSPQKLTNSETTCTTICDTNCIINGTLVQKFLLPAAAWTIEGDESNVYVTSFTKFGAASIIYSYKKDSNGLLIGSTYEDSINSTLQLKSVDILATNLRQGVLYVSTETDILYMNATNPLPSSPTTTVVPNGFSPFAVFADNFNYIWICSAYPGSPGYVQVYDINGFFVSQLILTNMTSAESQCSAMFITDDDTLVFGSERQRTFSFNIRRENTFNTPTNLAYKDGYYKSGLITGMTVDKFNNLFMLDYDKSVFSVNAERFENVVTLPECSGDTWRDIWIDPTTDLVFLVAQTSYIYIVQYNPGVI